LVRPGQSILPSQLALSSVNTWGSRYPLRCLEQIIRVYSDLQKWNVYSTGKTITCFIIKNLTVTGFPKVHVKVGSIFAALSSLLYALHEKSKWRKIIEPNVKGELCKLLGKRVLAKNGKKKKIAVSAFRCPFLPLP